MSILREILSHPSNAHRRYRTVYRWALHNVRRRVFPHKVITVSVRGRLLTGPVDHPMMCFAVYIPGGHHDVAGFWALEQLLDSGDTFIDVGANIGLYSIQMDSIVGQSGCLVAIEPAQDQAAFLTRNLGRLQASTHLVQAAVADRERCLGFAAPGPTMGYLTPSASGREEIETTTLEAILSDPDIRSSLQYDRCVVKIDIEGWEPAALEGAESLLKGGVRGFLVEAKGHQTRSVVPWAAAVELLHEHGYRFVWPDVEGRQLYEFPDPPAESPFGDYLAVLPPGYDRLARGLRSDMGAVNGRKRWR